MADGSASTVRVRFAPSPTGHLHVGNARTALFNWLFARKHSGVNILRIEDTDVERSEQRFEAQLLEDLQWLGIDFDEGPEQGGEYGPYRQSDRMKTYHDYAERLVGEDKAYLCFCTADELETERKHALAEHRSPQYSGRCAKLDPLETHRRRAAGEACAIRLRIPDHPIRFHDIVHGPVEFASDAVSDPIIIRSSGMPVYNYVVVIDDAEMKITHVIRGDDHLSNTPKQVALYEALGWRVPEFAHLSTILGSDRERLSKRHGATSIANFRDMGVLPEALINYLALLGWAPTGGEREIFTPSELIKEFSLERVTPSPAVFDMEKLYWLNRHYVKDTDSKRITEIARHFFIKAGLLNAQPSDAESAWITNVIALLVPSVDIFSQLPQRAEMIFHYDATKAIQDPANTDVIKAKTSDTIITTFASQVATKNTLLSAADFKTIVNDVKNSTGVKGKDLFHPIRVMITGTHAGPEFDKLIPIIEEGSTLSLPVKVMSVRERVEEFMKARNDTFISDEGDVALR